MTTEVDDLIQSLSKMTTFGEVRADDFLSFEAERKAKQLNMRKAKKERELALQMQRLEEERKKYEDYNLHVEEQRLQDQRELQNMLRQSLPRGPGVGRGRRMDFSQSNSSSSSGSPHVSPSYGRERPGGRRRDRQSDPEYTIRPVIEEKTPATAQNLYGNQIKQFEGLGSALHSNEAQMQYWRSGQARHTKMHETVAMFDEVYLSDSPSSASPISSVSYTEEYAEVPETKPISPPEPPPPQVYRKRKPRMAAKFPGFETEESTEPNNNQSAAPHITDICGSSSRPLAPNGRKFASGPSINHLRSSQRILTNALIDAYKSTGASDDFVLKKEEFPPL